MFPRDDDDWSSWSAREEGTSDDDDVETVQVIDGDEEETDCPGIHFSIQSKLPFTTQSIFN
jgi:hypothetical protein